MKSISREELKQAIDRGNVIILDARSPEKFHKSHLPAALNIPAGRAAELAPQLVPNKNTSLVTYCVNFTWKLSEQLARELQALGYRNVRTYEEGRQDWMNAGLPLEGSAPYEPVPRFQPSTTEAEAEEKLRRVSYIEHRKYKIAQSRHHNIFFANFETTHAINSLVLLDLLAL